MLGADQSLSLFALGGPSALQLLRRLAAAAPAGGGVVGWLSGAAPPAAALLAPVPAAPPAEEGASGVWALAVAAKGSMCALCPTSYVHV